MARFSQQDATFQHGSIRSFAVEVSRLARSGPVGLRKAKEMVAQKARLMRQQGQATASLDLELQNSLQGPSSIYQNFDQKQGQIYQMLAKILKTVRDSESTLLDNIR